MLLIFVIGFDGNGNRIAGEEFGRDVEARAAYGKALQLFRAMQDRRAEANALMGLGQLEHKLGRNEEAWATYDTALQLYRAEQDGLAEAGTLREIGRLLKLDNNSLADNYFSDAITKFKSVGMVKEADETEGMLRKK